jgi:hypothetical protein
MRIERKLVISLTGEEFDRLSERAASRQMRLTDLVGQALSIVAMSDWSPLMSAATQRAIASAPAPVLSQIAVIPGQEDAVETVLRSESPAQQASRSALAMMVRFDPESCYLEAGTWLLAALLAYVALEPGYARDRSLPNLYRELCARHSEDADIFARMRQSTTAAGYVAENMRLLMRKRPQELVHVRLHACEVIEQYIYRIAAAEPLSPTAHIAVTLKPAEHEALTMIAGRHNLSLSMLGRAAIARLLHMRPHLALVHSEKSDA